MTGQQKSDFQDSSTREHTRPRPDLALVNRLLPADNFYFQLKFATGEFHASAEWLASFGYGDDCKTIAGWLDTMPLEQRDRLQQVLTELNAGTIDHYEGHVRMANAQGVAREVDISLIAERPGALLHGIQRAHGEPGDADNLRAGLSHQLANDFASITGYGELLKETTLTPAQQAYLEEILRAAGRSAEHLSTGQPDMNDSTDWPVLLGQALGIEGAQAGTAVKAPCDKNELTDLLRPLLDLRRRHAGEDVRIRLQCGRTYLRRVLACATCGSVFSAREFVRISLCDTGAPLHRNLVPAFFAPGFDANEIRPAERRQSVDDVGNAIEQLHKHGGHLTLRAASNQTAIDVYLPLPATDDRPAEATVGNRVLVVDDNAGVTRYLDTVLTGQGYEVTTAAGPEEALARFRERGGHFDLVISDVTMPGMSGQAMLREMQAQAPDLGIIICSGLGKVDECGKGWRTLGKPVERDKLLACVKEILGTP